MDGKVVKEAKKKAKHFKERILKSCTDWSVPEYLNKNIFEFSNESKFDRIFVGGTVTQAQRSFICDLLKDFGIAIMPLENDVNQSFLDSFLQNIVLASKNHQSW